MSCLLLAALFLAAARLAIFGMAAALMTTFKDIGAYCRGFHTGEQAQRQRVQLP
jgi:hypothetical protein